MSTRPATGEEIHIVHEFPVSTRPGADVVRATLQTYRGETWAHVRRWYEAETDGPDVEFKPGKGLAVKVSLLGDLKRAVDALVDAAEVPAIP